MAKQLKQIEQSERENRIVEVEYDKITRVIEFKIFVVRPDGKKARVLGGGAFEEQDLDRVAENIGELANDFAFQAAEDERLIKEFEESEGEDV